MTDTTPPTVTYPGLPDSAPVSVLDLIVAAVTDLFREQLDGAVDEIYAGLSAAFPGLYEDPDASTTTRREYRVLEPGVGLYRNVPPAAAVMAHRQGIEVQRRTVTETEWATEPNPNTAKARTQPLPVRIPVVPPVELAAVPS
jgi:hypothetical protein